MMEVLQSFFKNIPVHPYKPYSSFVSFSNKREKKMLLALSALLHYRPKCENAKVQSASGMVCCIMEDGQDLTVQIPFPFCSMLAHFFSEAKRIYVDRLKCLDSYQTNGQDSR